MKVLSDWAIYPMELWKKLHMYVFKKSGPKVSRNDKQKQKTWQKVEQSRLTPTLLYCPSHPFKKNFFLHTWCLEYVLIRVQLTGNEGHSNYSKHIINFIMILPFRVAVLFWQVFVVVVSQASSNSFDFT